MQHPTLTLSELAPAPALYTAELEGETVGVGTAEEFGALLADGIFDVTDPMRFRLVAS